jgi:hypothetical protein
LENILSTSEVGPILALIAPSPLLIVAIHLCYRCSVIGFKALG